MFFRNIFHQIDPGMFNLNDEHDFFIIFGNHRQHRDLIGIEIANRYAPEHLVLAVDHRFLDGYDWYLIKNSHGTGSGRRGYVWVRGDYMALRVLAVMVHKDAIDPALVSRLEAAG